MNRLFSLVACLAVLLVLQACATASQKPLKPGANEPAAVRNELYHTIARMDSLMFEAFNRQDVAKLGTFFASDVEFFHDKGGLTNYEQTMDGFKRLFANNQHTGLRRELVPGTLEVYPIPGYGAVETHLHKFCHKENGKDDCGVFKNMMIWQQRGTEWKVTRVVSYDH
ncbi:nuclear transport factor 2 family protein [Hymenobacter koreensis]|uniref:DUF4440 domain-containing protein n=1 Tax=Hymenobacter koreensis TaxID=1084523 RepID=A0ABP8IT86_9BACT